MRLELCCLCNDRRPVAGSTGDVDVVCDEAAAMVMYDSNSQIWSRRNLKLNSRLVVGSAAHHEMRLKLSAKEKLRIKERSQIR